MNNFKARIAKFFSANTATFATQEDQAWKHIERALLGVLKSNLKTKFARQVVRQLMDAMDRPTLAELEKVMDQVASSRFCQKLVSWEGCSTYLNASEGIEDEVAERHAELLEQDVETLVPTPQDKADAPAMEFALQLWLGHVALEVLNDRHQGLQWYTPFDW